GLALALIGAFGSARALLRARRRGVRRPGLARLLLLCASSLVGMAGVEAAAAAWLAWAHRMPALPTGFLPSPAGELSIVVLGGSAGLGYPYNPWCSPGQIVARELGRALPGRRFVLDLGAKMGATLEVEHQGLTRLTRKPDLMII